MDTKELLNKILQGQNEIQKSVSSIENDVQDIKNQQQKNTKRLKAVFEQTAGLSEFRTEMNTKIDDLQDDLEFLTKKETENEKDIYKIKKKVK